MEAIKDPDLIKKFNKGEIELLWVPPGAAQENPDQWKDHPPEQLEALNELIFKEDGVGWAGVGVINNRQVKDGWSKKDAVPTWLDGHGREQLAALKDDAPPIPALVGHWSPEDEAKIITYIDPIKDMATIRPEALLGLIEKLDKVPASLSRLTERLRSEAAFKLAVEQWNFPENESEGQAEQKHLVIKLFVYDESRYEELIGEVRKVINTGSYDAEISL